MSGARAGWTAVVLSGGRSRRLGGSPKHAVTIGGRTLLDRTLSAVAGASQVIVVGDGPAGTATVIREDPAFAGPAAAIGAALPLVETPIVTVTACDHPFVAEAIQALLGEPVDDVDGVIAIDGEGRRQNLLFTAKTFALQQAVADRESLVDVAVYDLLAVLSLRELRVSARALLDVDTWDDHAKLEDIDGAE
jgi:molybdopterin-guanine dinucleotide biosynthesis protein A